MKVMLNQKVSGIVTEETSLLTASTFKVLTTDAAKISTVIENMGKVRLENYQLLNPNSNCYGWRDAVLEKSGLKPVGDSPISSY